MINVCLLHNNKNLRLNTITKTHVSTFDFVGILICVNNAILIILLQTDVHFISFNLCSKNHIFVI